MPITRRVRSISPWIGCALAFGCGRTIEPESTPTESAATIATFSPDADNPCRSVLPFPSDLARNPQSGTLDLPYCPTDSAQQIALKSGLRSLTGYALNTPIYTTFSGELDPDSLAGNVLLLRSGAPDPVPAATVWSPTERRVYVQPAEPLLEGTTYTVVVLDDVLDASEQPIVSDQVFTFLKSRTPLVDFRNYSSVPALDDQSAASLEPLRNLFAPTFNMLDAAGIARTDVAVAWSFTTQPAAGQLATLHDRVDGTGATFAHEDSIAASAHPLVAAAGIPFANLCDIHTGRVTLGSVLAESGIVGPITGEDDADYMLITPRDPVNGCSDPWTGGRVAVFVHGLGRCKNDALALADTLAQGGFATLTVDGPRAGARSVNSLGDQDLDGCPDQPDTPELIALGDTPNPFSVRDHLRQWGLEVAQVATAAAAEPWTLSGEAEPATPAGAAVSVVGHSFGGIAALMAGQVSDAVETVAVTATSGSLGAAFSPLLEQAIRDALDAAGLDPNGTLGMAVLAEQLAQAVNAFTWALEPADPVYAARHYDGDSPPVLVQVVSGGELQAPLHGTDTQVALAEAFGQDLEAVTWSLECSDAGTARPLCDGPEAVVGAMLAPCVGDSTAAEFPLAFADLAAMQTQLLSFLASSGSCVGQLGTTGCNPLTDATPPCP